MSDNTERDKLAALIRTADLNFDGDDLSQAEYWGVWGKAIADVILAEFMPEHDERVKVEAWDESRDASGHLVYQADHYETKWTQDVVNPYRRES